MMRPLWLDYHRPAPGRQREGILLLVVGVVAAGILATEYFSLSSEVESLDEDVGKLRRTVDRNTRAVAAVAAASATEGGGEVGLQTAALPPTDWDGLLAGLELAAGEDVTLLQLRPGRERIELAGEAKDFAAATAYAGRLQKVPGFAKLQMTQSSILSEHPQHPLRFTIAVVWRKGAK